MNYLKKGLKRTLLAVKKHKQWFVLLIFLQAVFLGLFFYTSLTYQLKIYDNLQGVMDPLQEANYNATSIQQGEPFMEDMLSVYKNYQLMKNNVIQMLLWLALIYLVLMGAVWLVIHRMFGHRKEILHQLAKFCTVTIIFFLLLGTIFFMLSKSAFSLGMDMNNFSIILKIVTVIGFVLFYFTLTAYALINVKSWRKFLTSWTKTTFQQIHRNIMVLFFNLLAILISLYLVFITTDVKLFVLMLLFTLILIIVLVLTKMFWVSCVKE